MGRQLGCSSTKETKRSAWARRPLAVLADSTHGMTGSGVGAGSSAACAEGACSKITCALVPLTPKADTAARRGLSLWGQGRCSVSSSTAPADQSTRGVGWSTCRVLGSTPCRMAWTILMTPPAPAAATVCPMLDFNEPSNSGRCAGWAAP